MKWFPVKRRLRRITFGVTIAALIAVAAISFLAPKTSSADAGYNYLYLVGEHCHDLHDITHDFGVGGDHTRCHNGNASDVAGWQEVLADKLGCSGSMFYQHAIQIDPHDKSVTNTLWFTKQAEYKDCYEKSLNMYNAMTSDKGDCAITKDGSDNFNKCEDYQNTLHDTLGCDSSMFQRATADGKPNDNGQYWIVKPGASGDCKKQIDAVGNLQLRIIGADGKPITSPDAIKSDKVKDLGGGAGSGGADSNQLGCDASANPLTWIICPIINDVMVPAIAWTDNLITNQMVIPTNQIFCTNNDTCAAYYTAWASFRNIALGLIVIAGLIVVIAQAAGTEILDAYTIRKMLPRILVAAIAITLSWTLMNFAVTLSNNLGFGVRDLIQAPFHNLSSTINLNFSDNGLINLFFGIGAAGVAVPIWIATGGIGVLLSYVATAGLAVLVAVLVLVLREIAIIMMTLLAPVALIAYVLPNTQRIFRLWWESFIRALLMFPLIAAFIAAGRVFAAISLSDTSGSGIGPMLHGLIGFVAYFGPYFAIPMTFGMSGAMMSGIGNMINQRASSVQGLLGNYRKGQMQSRVARARAGGLYRKGFGQYKLRPGGKQRSIGGGLNTLGYWGLNADEMLPWKLGTTKAGKLVDGKEGIPGFRRGGHSLASQIKRANRDQTVKAVQDLDIGYKSARLMGGQFQYYYGALDDEHKAMLENNFAERDENGEIMRDKKGVPVAWKAPANWGERNQVADIFASAKGTEGLEAREAAGELKGVAGEFEKYTGSAETNRVDGRLLGLISAAKAGRLEMSDVANNYNALAGAGDQESAIRETTILQDALTGKRVSAARGHGMWWDDKGKAHSSYEDPLSEKAGSSLARINNQEIAGSKSEDLDALRETIVAHGSEYEMEMDEDGFVRKKLYNGKPKLKSDPIKQERARQIQARLKTLAQYNYGDSDVGVKVKDIWKRLGNDPDDLVWGKGGSTDARRAADMAEAAHQEPEPSPEQPA